jgi:hypothetical protein
VALSEFFSRANVLIWPADSPLNGGLDSKRRDSDQATLKVLKEVNANGSATVSSVTEARNLLLDYGRPALQYLRNSSTSQIADSFHTFLLSLYDSLAAAGNGSVPRR